MTQQIDYNKKKKPRIRILADMFGNDAGDEVNILTETEGEVYYYDGFRRWCFLYKKDEGVDFEWVRKPTEEMK